MSKKLPALILVALVIILGFWYFGPQTNSSWAVDKACSEVKSTVYNNCGKIPIVSGEMIYKDNQNYIVVVQFEIPEWNRKASCACLVYGYREDNCFVSKVTNEKAYDYNYKANLDELKALWALG